MKSIQTLHIYAWIIGLSLCTGLYAAELDLDSLHAEYLGLTTRSNPVEAIAGDVGKQQIEAAQKFIKNNPDALNTPKGKSFLGIHNKMVRIRLLKNKLDNCLSGELNDAKYHNNLPDRIFEAALTLPDSDIPCEVAVLSGTESLDELMASMSGVANEMVKKEDADDISDFQGTIHMQGIENALKTLVNLNYTYRDLGNQDEISDDYIDNHLLNKVCSTVKLNSGPGPRSFQQNRCNDDQKDYLRKFAKREFNNLKASNTKRYTNKEAREEILKRIDKVNETIRGLEFDINDNWIRDDINFESDKSIASHQAYVSSFMAQTSSGPGMLMWTDAIGGRMGSRRDRDSDSLFGIIGGGFDPSSGTYKEHDTAITASHVKEAIDEAEERVLQQTRSLHIKELKRKREHRRMKENPGFLSGDYSYSDIVESRREDMMEMTAKNPVLVGQSLMKDPTKIDEACIVIKDIAEKSKEDEGWSFGKALMWGGAFVGGALLVATGVGAIMAVAGGAAVLGGAAVTGAGLLSAAGVTFKGLAVAGFVYGVAETSVEGTRYVQANRERNEILAAYLAGGGDSQNADEFLQVMDEAQDAGWNAAAALGFTVLDIPGAMAIGRALKNGPKVQMKAYWTDMKQALDMIANGSRLKGIINQSIKQFGKKETQRMLKQLLKQDKPNELLTKLKGMSDEDALEFFSKGIKVCEEMCS